MAILARASITLSTIRDVSSTIRYYKLQASTASPPAKPTTNPPGNNWVTTEPSYTENSTNSLYTTDLTIFTDGDFYYSDVSLSSSYEAAKAAYNKSVVALSQSVEYIVGTQTASTNAWTGVTTDAALVTGKTIAYKLPYAGTSTAATLNLTLSGGGTTGAKAVYTNTTAVTTHFGANAVINMTYDGTQWRANSIPNTNTFDRVQHNNRVLAAANISGSHLIVGNSSGYKQLNASGTVTFDLTYPILYATAAFSSGVYSTSTYEKYPGVKFSNETSIQGFAANKVVFLKGTVNKQIFTRASSGYLTCTVPTGADGYCYIPLGVLANDATSSNAIGYFSTSNQLYAYKAGLFGPVSIREAAAAAKTATNYLTDINNAGVFVHESNDSDVTPTTPGANGVHISNDVDIIRDGEVVARYGEKAIIGKEFVIGEQRNQIQVSSEGFDLLTGTSDYSSSIAHLGYMDRLRRGESFRGDGVQTQFTLIEDILEIDHIMVNRQDPETGHYYYADLTESEYSYSGKVVTLVEPPPDDPNLGWVNIYYYSKMPVPFYTIGTRTYDGSKQIPIGPYSVALGIGGEASGYYSIAEGDNTHARGSASHAEGRWTTASGEDSHAEGMDTVASGVRSHAEGGYSEATGRYSHAEGYETQAGEAAHAEGSGTIANGYASHAEGSQTVAYWPESHAQNLGTIAKFEAQTALGTYNVEDDAQWDDPQPPHPSDNWGYGNYAVIIGNGTDDLNRSNALTVDWAGNVDALKFRGKQHLLWSGAAYLNQNQTANLSETVSSQANGIVLVWSAYGNGAAQNYDWFYYFVPKEHVEHRSGAGISMGLMCNASCSSVGTKYVYVHDDRVAGHSNNYWTGTGSGVTANNSHWVLRAVVGV